MPGHIAIPQETVKDPDKVFYHIAVGVFAPKFDFNDIPPHAFTPVGTGLCVNWDKYCSNAEECLKIKTDRYPEGRDKTTHGVGHFIAGEVRSVEVLDVIHSPSLTNIAHCHIDGIPPNQPKEPFVEMRKLLKRAFKSWDIAPVKE